MMDRMDGMKKFRFIHCADFHLDSPFSMFGQHSEKAEIRRQDIQKTVVRILQLANDRECDAVLFCGDLYEHHHIRKSTVEFLMHIFKRFSHISCFIIAGNHDPDIEGSLYRSLEWPSNVHLLNAKNSKFEMKDVCIYGAGFQDFYAHETLIDTSLQVNKDKINILMTHGTVEFLEGGQGYNPIRISDVQQLGLDYCAIGHFHNSMENIGEIDVIYNPGSPEPLGFDERGFHGVFLVEIEKKDALSTKQIQFLQTQTRWYWTVDIDMTGVEVIDECNDVLQSMLRDVSLDRCLLTVSLHGFLNKDLESKLTVLWEELKRKVFWLQVENQTEPQPDLEEIAEEDGILGAFAKKILKKLQNEMDYTKRIQIWRAYRFGLEALIKHKIEL